jgi:hypothetical protein
MMKNRKKSVPRNHENLDSRHGIPKYTPDAVFTSKFRYCVTSSASDVATFALELPIAPFGIADSSSTILLPFKSVRLNSFKVWCNYRPDKDITGNTISVTMIERRGVRPIEWTDIATYQQVAYVSKKFSKTEFTGLYYSTINSQENPELKFQLPKGAVLELNFSWVLSDSESLGTSSSSGLSYPKVYTNRLSTSLEPIGRSYAVVITM